MRDDDVRARLGHRDRVGFAEHVRRREQALAVREPDHVDFERVAHPGFLEVRAEVAVDEADGREVLHAGKPEPRQLVEERVEIAERIGAVHAGEHGRRFDDGQHLARHVDDDLVRVAVREQPRERAAPGHPVAARVVDHDEIDAARLFAFRGQARSRAAADDRLAARDGRAQFFEDLDA
ncbi:hypothetical protein DO70_4478 [Burkholderia pseudomallei]|nr:hypothetical protein DO70_4478 [Burkholderia pseudomallei]